MTATLETTESESASAPVDPVDDSAGSESQPRPPSRPVPAALAPWDDPHRWHGWVSTAIVTVVAVLTRFWSLGYPPGPNIVPKNGMNFDEVYYAVEAQEMLRYGYEDNRGFLFIVHPPLGKLLIALSEKLWDRTSGEWLTNSLGWRIAPATFGCLGVIMMSRIVRRVTRSNLLGLIGGLFMAMEGLSLVLARTAILDIFLQTFVIAAFGALVIDRDTMRARLAGMIADGVDLTRGVPSLGPRPWRLAGGVLIGLAGAVKWTALSFFVVFVLMSWFWDRAALRSAGVRRPLMPWARRSVLPSFGSLIVAPICAYLLTYLGWFTGENGYNRHWADTHSASAKIDPLAIVHIPLRIPFNWGWLPGPLRSLGAQIHDAYAFHEGLDSGHVYQSNPWSWLVLGRPVDFYYNGSETTCGAPTCSRTVLLMGTPLMWWMFAPMLLWLAWHWLTTRDWRAAAVLAAFAAGWLVWFQDLKRTMFLFYMAPLVPFLVLGLTLALGAMLGPALPQPLRAAAAGRAMIDEVFVRAHRRRRWGMAGVSVVLAVVIADFVWMWPIFTGGLLTYGQWHAHMWLPSWV